MRTNDETTATRIPTTNTAGAPTHFRRRTRTAGAAIAAGLLVFGLAGMTWLAGPAADASTVCPVDQAQEGGPDMGEMLISGLGATKGCLGVETARTGSGKNVIFAWFEDREACLRWYYSDVHMAMMSRFPREDGKNHDDNREPLSGVPANYDGPILAVASITFTDGDDRLQGVSMPISQIAIELYAPLTGGLHLGGRFAPEAMKLESTRDVALEYGAKDKSSTGSR